MTPIRVASLLFLLALGCQRSRPVNIQEAAPEHSAFTESKAGEEREVAGIKLCCGGHLKHDAMTSASTRRALTEPMLTRAGFERICP
jgi:hypothetical protein